MTDFLTTLKERELLAQVTHEDELHQMLEQGSATGYVGFDPTATSLHVGSLLPIMIARLWQRAGNRIIILVGGGTALVGDPTGKSDMRPMSTEETIKEQADAIRAQLSRFIDFSDPAKAILVDNSTWLKGLNYLDFLREIGPHFNVNRMLDAECFKQRMANGLSFLEFNYMIFQGYDFLQLFHKYQCKVQFGGDDQWSNMLAGMDLIRKTTTNQAFCITTPLLVSASGKKMGKTQAGAVWIDADKTSPYELYQYFRNVADSDVRKCLFTFTDVPADEVRALTANTGATINQAKERLAFEATKIIHGSQHAEDAQQRARSLFLNKSVDDAPEVYIDRSKLADTNLLVDLLVKAEIFPSKSEARRMMKQGGVSLGEAKVTDTDHQIPLVDLQGESGIIIKKGKKSYYSLRVK